MRRRKPNAAVFVATAIAIFVAVWSSRQNEPRPSSTPASVDATAKARVEPNEPTPATRRNAPPAETNDAPPARSRNASNVDLAGTTADEREQIERTLALIERGGPFPYEKDGTVFANREKRLPQQKRGYYREYTVRTPGASNRGARRIVRGASGETYYTRDHYRTFTRIDNGGHASSAD